MLRTLQAVAEGAATLVEAMRKFSAEPARQSPTPQQRERADFADRPQEGLYAP